MKLGTNDIGSVYLGSNAVQKVYLGANEVWSAAPPTPLLDDYPNAAAAYSLRLLRSAYTGDAIGVRIDTTGQPEYNIGFVDGELDVATLEGYCTGGLNAYVKTWYDQSGNGINATQTTAASQPQIVSSGSVLLQNNKPAIYFDGSNYQLNGIALSNYITNSTWSNIAVFNPIALTTNSNSMERNDCLWMDGAAGYAGVYWKTTGNLFAGVWDGNIKQASVAITANTQILSFAKMGSGNISISKNNGSFVNATAGNIQTVAISLTIARNNVWSEIYLQELIFYKTDQSSNANGIKSNVNAHYAIY
jgi:hypothetical protein